MNIITLVLLGLVLAVLVFKFIGARLMVDQRLVKAKIEEGALILDVRTPGEYSSGHYPGAINIPLDQIGRRINELGDKTRPIVVYCLSGARSYSARSILMAQGFRDVVNGGGIGMMPR